MESENNKPSKDNAFLEELRRLCEPLCPQEPVDAEKACRVLGLLGSHERLQSLEELFSWTRGGAESYICGAQLQVMAGKGSLEQRRYILKAVFSSGPSSPKRLADMLARYEALKSENVSVPRTYFAGDGVLLQDYIHSSLHEFLCRIRKDDYAVSQVRNRVMEIAKRLDKLRFSPVVFVHDLRVTEDGELVIVDVGEDLGPAGQAPFGSRKAEEQAENALERLMLSARREDAPIERKN